MCSLLTAGPYKYEVTYERQKTSFKCVNGRPSVLSIDISVFSALSFCGISATHATNLTQLYN